MPASMAFATDSNRPQPLWQPPPTACLTASGAASEVPPLLMHPWGGPLSAHFPGMLVSNGVTRNAHAPSVNGISPQCPPMPPPSGLALTHLRATPSRPWGGVRAAAHGHEAAREALSAAILKAMPLPIPATRADLTQTAPDPAPLQRVPRVSRCPLQRGGLAQGLGIRLCAFGGADWPLATAHSDPLWARTCFGCVNRAPG